MPTAEPQITIALINGEKLTFVVPDEAALKSHLCPNAQATLFDPPTLFFGNSISLIGLRTSSIAWIRVHPSIELPWTFPFGADLIEWTTREEFDRLVPLKRIATKLAISNEPIGTDIQIFIRVHSGDSTLHHFRVTTHTLSKATRLSIPDAIAQLPLYFGKHPEGGWIIINLKTILHLEAMPGTVDLPASVWPLLRIGEDHH